MPTDTCLIL